MEEGAKNLAENWNVVGSSIFKVGVVVDTYESYEEYKQTNSFISSSKPLLNIPLDALGVRGGPYGFFVWGVSKLEKMGMNEDIDTAEKFNPYFKSMGEPSDYSQRIFLLKEIAVSKTKTFGKILIYSLG